MAKTQTQLAADINALTAQVQTIGKAVTDLEAALAAAGGVGGTVTQELQDAVDKLTAAVQTDVASLPPPPTPPPAPGA